jgi:1-acyl-sn-glycerol-3-phosphate acyltransferase
VQFWGVGNHDKQGEWSKPLSWPTVGTKVARRGNMFSQGFGRFGLRLLGWKVGGSLPDQPKMVLIGAPHTTNMDGVIAIGTLLALRLRANTMIKDSAFKGPLGVVLRWFGAIPVARHSPKGIVEQSVDAFNQHERLILLIAPEGTRSSAAEWKSGFYRIALQAGVPIVPAACHYRRRIITFGPPVYPTGDYEADLCRILEFISENGAARHPQRMSRPLRELMGETGSDHHD